MIYALVENNKIIDYIVGSETYLDRLKEIFADKQVIEIGVNEAKQISSIGEYYVNGQYKRYMKIANLTVEQYRKLYGQYLKDDRIFNFFISPDGSVSIPEEDINDCTNTALQWVKDLVIFDYSTTLPDTTPPSMTGYGILIPTEAETLNLFPDNKFNLGGYVIELTSTSQGLAVDLGYLGWTGFREEQDKAFNSTIKDSFSALWYELLTRYQNNEIIQL